MSGASSPLQNQDDGELAPLSDETFRKIRDWIYETSGMYFPDKKKYLVRGRLQDRLREHGFTTYEEYYFYLKGEGREDGELEALYNQLTTGETYFYRNQTQLQALQEEVFPEISQRKTDEQTIRILSAGCATGEEPYSIAILFHEMQRDFGMKICPSIVGVDISTEAIKKARTATYDSYSLKKLSEKQITSYFTREGNQYRVDSELQSRVEFHQGNLIMEDSWRINELYDVILCRNVLIYLGEKAKRKLMEHAYEHLVPDGYVLTANAESLREYTELFKPVSISGTIVYRKK